MTAIFMERTLSGLTPADDMAKDALRRLHVGDVVRVEFSRPRHLASLRRWWALVHLICHQTDQFKSADIAHQWLKLMAGHAQQIVSKTTGEVYLVADSIAFSRLDETEFQDVWQRAVRAVIEHILPGVTDNEIETEIMQIVGLAGGRK